MKKVITEILLLVWRVVRVYLWKWLRPHLRKLGFLAVVFVAVIGILTMLIASSC